MSATDGSWGDGPLVEPFPTEPLAVRDRVAARTPVNDRGDPVVRGIVLDVTIDEDGEQQATIAAETRQFGTKRTKPRVEWRYHLARYGASDLDPAWHTPAAMFQPGRDAAKILLAVAAEHEHGKAWSNDDIFLVGAALRWLQGVE